MNYKFRRTVTLVILFGLILFVLVSGPLGHRSPKRYLAHSPYP